MRTLIASLLLIHALPAVAAPDHPAELADKRTVITLSATDRAHVLAEMRAFLAGLQRMTQALAKGDFKSVAATAKSLGAAMTHEVPESLKRQLPPEFRNLGFSVHADFDRIALDADTLGDTQHTLAQLGETLGRCVACHQAYQIQSPPGPRK